MFFPFVAFLITISNLISTSAAPSIPNDCPARLLVMDGSLKVTILIANPNVLLYTNESQINEDYCIPVLKNHMKVLIDYKSCLRAFPKQLYSLFISSTRKNVKGICTTPNQRKELIEKLKCFTVDTFQHMIQLSHQVTSLIEYLANMTDIDRMIPGMCCGYHIMLKESREIVEGLCNQQGVGKSGSEYFVELLKSAVADALDMMCGSYETPEQCNKKMPGLNEEMTMVRIATINKQYNYTAVVPFLKVIDRIDTETNINTPNVSD